MQSLIKNDVCMNRIKEELEAKGISQTELANRLGKTFNMVNLYATNKVQPPIPVLYQIADILNISTNTVYRHRQNILSALQVSNTAAAIQVGFRLNII